MQLVIQFKILYLEIIPFYKQISRTTHEIKFQMYNLKSFQTSLYLHFTHARFNFSSVRQRYVCIDVLYFEMQPAVFLLLNHLQFR